LCPDRQVDYSRQRREAVLKQDPVLERADSLVGLANIFAMTSYQPWVNRFPVLRKVDAEHWDFIVTIATVFMAATRLRNLCLGDDREEALMELVAV
jgi:hypothetical protein